MKKKNEEKIITLDRVIIKQTNDIIMYVYR